jgi:L-asparagine transporter-like permease
MLAISMFGPMFTWLMIFVTHLRFRQRHREEKLPFRMWGYPFTSLAGAMLMSAALITTLFTREFRPTLVYGLPFLVVLATVYALRRGRAVAIAQPAVEETQPL